VIKSENELIEKFEKNISSKITAIKDFNNELVRSLELFQSKIIVERKIILEKHFDQI
jgi:hypothetical protein